MLKRLLILAIFIASSASSASYGETVYKCKNAQGRVLYSGVPCPDGRELHLDVDENNTSENNTSENNTSENNTSSGGLRPSEKAALKSIDEQQAKAADANQRDQAEQTQIEGCAGISIVSGTSETYTSDGQNLIGNEVQNRCVLTTLMLDGYYGSRINSDLQLAIEQRFSATFVNGEITSAQTIKFVSGPERIDVASQYQVELCFGASVSELAAVGCR